MFSEKKAEDILKILSEENCLEFIKISKNLLNLYSSDVKYRSNEINLKEEINIIEQYYNSTFNKKVEITFKDLEDRFRDICSYSDMNSSTVSVKHVSFEKDKEFIIFYDSFSCDYNSTVFQRDVLNPRIDKTFKTFSLYLTSKNIPHRIYENNTRNYTKTLKLLGNK
jgi:hypothetical protein